MGGDLDTVEVIARHYQSRGPMALAREVLLRALFEMQWDANPTGDQAELFPGQAAEKAAREAKRRRRAWMTVNGTRYLGVGADGDEYRSAVVVVDDQLVAAVVPTSQKEIVVRLTDVQADSEQGPAGGEIGWAEVAAV